MTARTFSLLFLLALPALFFAQKKNEGGGFQKFFEAGPWVGLANYSGDVAQNRIVLGETKVGYGFAVRCHFARHLDLRAHIMHGSISGSDQNSSDVGIRARNFKFFSPLTELGVQAEYIFIDPERMTGTGVFTKSISPVVFAGGALAFIDPSVTCDRPGSTNPCPTFPEPGQKKRRVSFPVGIGVRADLVEQLSLGAEIGWRPTFADDLDGVSINGNKNANDWYVFFGATVGYVFGGNRGRLH